MQPSLIPPPLEASDRDCCPIAPTAHVALVGPTGVPIPLPTGAGRVCAGPAPHPQVLGSPFGVSSAVNDEGLVPPGMGICVCTGPLGLHPTCLPPSHEAPTLPVQVPGPLVLGSANSALSGREPVAPILRVGSSRPSDAKQLGPVGTRQTAGVSSRAGSQNRRLSLSTWTTSPSQQLPHLSGRPLPEPFHALASWELGSRRCPAALGVPWPRPGPWQPQCPLGSSLSLPATSWPPTPS